METIDFGKNTKAVQALLNSETGKSWEQRKAFKVQIDRDLNYMAMLENRQQQLTKAIQSIVIHDKPVNPVQHPGICELMILRHEVEDKAAIHRSIVADKVRHFQQTFMPGFAKRIKVAAANFPARKDRVEEILKNPAMDDTWTELQRVWAQYKDVCEQFGDDESAMEEIDVHYYELMNRMVYLYDQKWKENAEQQ